MYKVIKPFTDLQDGNHVYFSGEPYPRRGYTPPEDRVAELAGKDNKLGYPLIVRTSGTPTEAHERVLEGPLGVETGVNESEATEAKENPKKAQRRASKKG